MVSIEVSKTYSIVTPESAERGDYAEHGYCYNPMLLRLKDVLNEINKLGAVEIESSFNEVDFYSVDSHTDMCDGSETTYHIRVKAHPRVIKRILKLVKMP
jgi:hypothetical protein